MGCRKRAPLILMVLTAVSLLAAGDHAAATTGSGGEPGSALVQSAGFEALIDRYLCEVRGVGCSRGGSGGINAESVQRRIGHHRLRSWADLEAVDRATLTMEQGRRTTAFLRGILKANIRTEGEVQRWRQDPRRYAFTNGIIFKIQAGPPTSRRAGSRADRRAARHACRFARCRGQPNRVHSELAALLRRAHRTAQSS